MILLGPFSALSQPDGLEKLETNYGNYIDEYISKLENRKVMLSNTRSENLRNQSLLDCMKLDFLKTYRENIAKTLSASAEEVGLKPYKIQFALNREFFSTLKHTKKLAGNYNCSECGHEINLKTI
jgi:hypothetical protein